MTSGASVAIVLFSVLTLCSHSGHALLRRKTGSVLKRGAIAAAAKGPGDDAHVEIIEKSQIESKKATACMCPLGKFWHWRIRQCIDQGAWGYECGFFPKEHWHRVCQDGLKCAELQTQSQGYFHDGAHPASCQRCKPEDNCLAGEKRQAEECLVEYTLLGEACTTIKIIAESSQSVTAEETAKATSTESVTAKSKAIDAASAKATETNCTQHAVGEEAGIKVKIPVESTASAEATRAHTAEVSAEGKGKATEEVTATAQGQGTASVFGSGTACVPVEDAKKMLGLEVDAKVAAVVASKVVATAKKKAFESAYATALSKVVHMHPHEARALAAKLDAAKATKIAKLLAEAAAKEKAAWVAESDASAEAKLAAEKAAEETASAKAVEEATRKAEAKADDLAVEAAAQGAKEEAKKAAKEIAKNKACAKAREKALDKEPEAEAQADDAASAVKGAIHPAPQKEQAPDERISLIDRKSNEIKEKELEHQAVRAPY